MTLRTGRAQGVIQEVATDKIEQIAEEEKKLFRLHRSATRALWTRAGLLQAFTHNEAPNHLF